MFICELPSKLKVSVEPPTYAVRVQAVQEFRSAQSREEIVGYTVEELMAAKCLTAINGDVVDQNLLLDPIMLMEDWPQRDVQFYLEWYMTMFFLDDKMREKAANAAKKLMMGQAVTGKKQKTVVAKV